MNPKALIKALTLVTGRTADNPFTDPMGAFVKDLGSFALIKEISEPEGPKNRSSVDVTTKDGDVFTIDLTPRGFEWVDFDREDLLGKNYKQAAKTLKKIIKDFQARPGRLVKKN